MSKGIDFGKTAADYARHRTGFPQVLMERLKGWSIGLPGQRILDLGTGTGSLARLFACRGCHVSAIDPSTELVDQARALDQKTGVEIDYHIGRAEQTGLPGSQFDIITAGQCWHWFNAPEACLEITRLLKPDGRIVIAHFDWLPLDGNVVAMTEKLILDHNPEWSLGGGTGLYPQWFRDLGQAGFLDLESFSLEENVPYSHEDWRGRIRASAGIAASLPEAQVAAFDRDHQRMLSELFPEDPLMIPHRLWALIGKAPPRRP